MFASSNKNVYFLKVIFMSIRYFHSFLHATASTILKCFTDIHSLQDTSSSIFCSRAFSSKSRTTSDTHWKRSSLSHAIADNPAGNGQEKKHNETLWKLVTMANKPKNLSIMYWQDILQVSSVYPY